MHSDDHCSHPTPRLDLKLKETHPKTSLVHVPLAPAPRRSLQLRMAFTSAAGAVCSPFPLVMRAARDAQGASTRTAAEPASSPGTLLLLLNLLRAAYYYNKH